MHASTPGPAVVVVRLVGLAELPVCVAIDHRAPELLSDHVPGELRELPRPRRQVEHHPGGLLATAAPPKLPQHEKLADLVRALAGVGGLVADQHEAGQRAVGADEECAAATPGPEAPGLCRLAEEHSGG